MSLSGGVNLRNNFLFPSTNFQENFEGKSDVNSCNDSNRAYCEKGIRQLLTSRLVNHLTCRFEMRRYLKTYSSPELEGLNVVTSVQPKDFLPKGPLYEGFQWEVKESDSYLGGRLSCRLDALGLNDPDAPSGIFSTASLVRRFLHRTNPMDVMLNKLFNSYLGTFTINYAFVDKIDQALSLFVEKDDRSAVYALFIACTGNYKGCGRDVTTFVHYEHFDAVIASWILDSQFSLRDTAVVLRYYLVNQFLNPYPIQFEYGNRNYPRVKAFTQSVSGKDVWVQHGGKAAYQFFWIS